MTTVTVREIMTLPVLRGTYVLAGEAGLDRVVSGVNVMEVPDIEGFVKQGEFLLTTAYPVRDRPERLVELLPVLAATGLAALAVKPLRYLDRIPERLLTEADRLGFPVLILPDDTSFNEVIGAVLAVVLAEYGAEPARAEAIRERLTGVALAGGGLDEIARTLGGALGREVLIVDEEAEVLSGGDGWTADEGGAGWDFPITVAGANRGKILVGGPSEPSLGQRRLIRQACFAAGMHIAQAMAGLELDRRLRVLYLEELVTGPHLDEHVVMQRSRLFGWNFAAEQVVMLARGPVELSDTAVASLATATLGTHAIAWSRGHEIVAIVPAGALRARADAAEAEPEGSAPARWRRALDEAGRGGTVVAVGSVSRSPGGLSSSHVLAREALRIAEVTGRDVVWQDDLVTERLLLAVPSDVLRAFVDEAVGPLLAHDAEHEGDLSRTLETYLGVANGAEAARRLYIHYNTLKHRMARIVELTGADLHDPRDRLTLSLALHARKLL